jgi:serralysin
MKTLLLLPILLLTACAGVSEPVEPPSPPQPPVHPPGEHPCSKTARMGSCVAIDANLLGPETAMDVMRIWAHPSKVWKSSEMPLRVRFLGGSNSQRTKAWQRFQTVDGMCGVSFTIVDAGPSDIRVAFGNTGHWSYLGTDCKGIPQNAPTMNLQLDAWEDGTEWDRVGLHEICHALGCPHEHQHPQAGIPWNERKVIDYYARTQGWSEDETRQQVLDRYRGSDFLGTEPDPCSIMMYPIDPSLTTNGFKVGWNVKFSPNDIAFLKRIYPEP